MKISRVIIIVLVLLGIFRIGDIFFHTRKDFSDKVYNEGAVDVLFLIILVGFLISIPHIISFIKRLFDSKK